MKKTIAMLTALTLTAALAIPLSASAAEITPKGGTEEFDISPNPGDTSAEVSLGVDPAYLITIPAKFELTKTGEATQYTGSGDLTAENVFLPEGKDITVSITSASGFNMSSGGEYTLPYTAEGAFGKITDKQNGGKVARFLTYSEKQTIPVTFTTDENPMYAGKYTDPVVFHIAVTDEEPMLDLNVRFGFIEGDALEIEDNSVEVAYLEGNTWENIAIELTKAEIAAAVSSNNLSAYPKDFYYVEGLGIGFFGGNADLVYKLTTVESLDNPGNPVNVALTDTISAEKNYVLVPINITNLLIT